MNNIYGRQSSNFLVDQPLDLLRRQRDVILLVIGDGNEGVAI